jgi:hypothetical protein
MSRSRFASSYGSCVATYVLDYRYQYVVEHNRSFYSLKHFVKMTQDVMRDSNIVNENDIEKNGNFSINKKYC